MEEDPVETAPHGAAAYEGGLGAMALLGTMAAVLILIGVALLKPLLAAQEGIAGTGGSDFEAQIAVPENRIATERTTLSVGSDAPRWLANARPFPLAPAQPAIAVILIETGAMRHAVGKLLSKNRNLTLALAHDFETARWRAQAARRDGHEILTLLPTEYDAVFSRHANVLGRHLGRAELQRRLGWHLAAMEVSVGAMDLGGGDILRDAGALGEAMEVLAEGGGLFVDSRSDSGSIAAPVARAQGVPVAQRTVRLEERDDPQRIASKLADAETHARRWKNAVVVVEPGEVALAGLLAWLDTRDPSITLAPVSAVVGRLRAGG